MCLFSARYVEGAFVVRKVRTMGKPHVFCQPKLAGLSKHGRVPYTYRTRVLENHMFVISGRGAGLDFRHRITSTSFFEI